jgi:hypothetical protein
MATRGSGIARVGLALAAGPASCEGRALNGRRRMNAVILAVSASLTILGEGRTGMTGSPSPAAISHVAHGSTHLREPLTFRAVLADLRADRSSGAYPRQPAPLAALNKPAPTPRQASRSLRTNANGVPMGPGVSSGSADHAISGGSLYSSGQHCASTFARATLPFAAGSTAEHRPSLIQ